MEAGRLNRGVLE
ncbi:hypothetical protein EC01288_4545, partial [Escherichia coli 0.1288]